MEQNTDKWLEWRSKGLGASDAPIILGVSPYKTPYQLWEEKLGLKKSVGNWATQRGHDLEPKAKATFELEMDMDFPSMLATHNKISWLRASLDGYNADKKAVLEIKCPGKDDHETAKQGRIPDKYWPQIQHQLLVTGADICYYYSYDGETGVTVEAKPDVAYCKDLYSKLESFWELIKSKTEPKLTDKDQVQIDDAETVKLADQYAKLDDDAKAIKKAMEEIKKKLVEKVDHAKTKIGRISITKSVRKGNVDYSKVPALDGVDVEEFRKDATPTVTVKVGKK
jgi:putative phage-type endonuclease